MSRPPLPTVILQRCLEGTLALLLAAQRPATVVAQIAPAATLRGHVVDRRSGEGVPRARVTLTGQRDTITAAADGRFEIPRLAVGARVVQARAIGYTAASWVLELTAAGLDVTLELEPSIPVLDTLRIATAADRSDPNDWRSPQAFERRRERGVGRFLTEEQIVQANPRTLGDLLRNIPGVSTTCTSRTCTVRMQRAARPCLPEYYLDGFPATNATGPDFPISAIGGVEIYASSLDVPSEFARPNMRCGVIAIWTRPVRVNNER